MSAPDVVVIGGGVIGCGIARSLALRGASVAVLERGRAGAEASWAAAGMLSPQAEADAPGPFLELLLRSRLLYPDFAAALLEETGTDIDYRTEGTLLVSLSGEDDAALDARYAWQRAAGLEVERLGAGAVRALEPALADGARGALRFPGDHQVDNRRLGAALPVAAARAGARLREHSPVRRVRVEGGAVVGVELEDGERIAAGAVVVAAGAWAGELAGLPRPLPVVPIHGQMIALTGGSPPLRHVVDTPAVYLVPRRDGRVLCGATMERVGLHKAVTAGGVVRLLRGAIGAVPGLSAATLAESWSGLRPGTPDGLPILGEDPEVRCLHYATGHFRNGILLAPITAEAVTAAVLRLPAPVDLLPYSPNRPTLA